MNHYIDIRVRPDQDFPASQLMGALYGRLHRALVARGTGDIGVSFPEHRAQSLGNALRLHGSAQALAALMAHDWLLGMRDHLSLAPSAAAPTDAQYRQVRRVQTKSSPERLRRRQMKRHNLTEAEAAARIPDTAARLSSLPSVFMRSASTGQAFRLFIQHGPTAARPGTGSASNQGATAAYALFNAYGLSQQGWIPWF